MKETLYDSNLIINTSKFSDGRNVIDLNLLCLDGFFQKNSNINRSASGVNKFYFDQHVQYFSDEMYQNAKIIASFINGYELPGRKNIFNALKEFFEFQVNNGKSIRDTTTINDYCILLQSKIYSRKIGKIHAAARLSAVNKFLTYTGDIYSDYKYQFSTKRYRKKNESYTESELTSLMIIIYPSFRS